MKKNNTQNDPNAILQLFGTILQQQFASDNVEPIPVKDPSNELISNQEISRLTKHLNDINGHLKKIQMLFRMSIKNTYNLEEACELTQFTKSKIYRDTSLNEVKFTKHFGKTLQFEKQHLLEYLLKEKPSTK
jgi:hypothetical protein